MQAIKMVVASCPDEELVGTNCVYISAAAEVRLRQLRGLHHADCGSALVCQRCFMLLASVLD